MSEKVVKSLKDLRGGTLDELLLESATATEEIGDDTLIKSLATTADEWEQWSHLFSILHNAKRDAESKDDINWAHAQLMRIDDQYAERYAELRAADERLKASKNQPAPNSAIAQHTDIAYEKNKTERCKAFILDFNSRVDERLAAIPEDIRVLLETNDQDWKEFKNER